MSGGEDEKKAQIEVRTPEDAPEKVKRVASDLQTLFDGPVFARLVRDAVAEMVYEGKLGYDMDEDTFDIPEDIVKRWAAKMEKRYWSRRIRRNR